MLKNFSAENSIWRGNVDIIKCYTKIITKCIDYNSKILVFQDYFTDILKFVAFNHCSIFQYEMNKEIIIFFISLASC